MIVSKKFRDIRTGEIVTQFPLMDIGFMEEVEESELQTDDLIWAYCDNCEAKIPADEHAKYGVCEECSRRRK